MEEETIYYDNDTKIITTKNMTSEAINGGFGTLLYKRMKYWSKHNVIIQEDPKKDQKETMAEFLDRCIKVSIFMQKSGIGPGDLISICTDYHFNSNVPLTSALFVGAISASTDRNHSFEETKHLIGLVKPKMFFVNDETKLFIEKCLKELNITCTVISFDDSNLWDEILNIDIPKNFTPYYENDCKSTAVVIFTSGSTGLPKAACITHQFLMSELKDLRIPANFRFFGFSSSYWSNGLMFFYLSCLFGFTMLIHNGFDPEKYWNLLEDYKVGAIFLSYTKTASALKYLKKPNPHLKSFAIVGGQINADHKQFLKKMLPSVRIDNYYGATEMGRITKCTNDTPFNSIGTPILNGQLIKVVDPETEEPLGPNEIGEIRIKSEYQMSGYYGVDSSDCWDCHGFMKSGDFGYFDLDFNMFIVDRIKEVFNSRISRISPVKIENVLLEHEDVLLAIAFGVPHPQDDNHIAAAVVLRDSATVTSEELLKFANSKLESSHQIHKNIWITQKINFVYTPTGKIVRRKIKQQYFKEHINELDLDGPYCHNNVISHFKIPHCTDN